MRYANIQLHIGELVLHGFSPGDRNLIGDAMRAELQDLFVKRGVPEAISRGDDLARVSGGDIDLPSSGNLKDHGHRLAVNIYETLNRPLPTERRMNDDEHGTSSRRS